MLKNINLFFAVAFICAQPTIVQAVDIGNNRVVFITIDSTELVELSFRLSGIAKVDGVLKKMHQGECDASFDIISRDFYGLQLGRVLVKKGVGEVWINTQFERTVNKNPSGEESTATYILTLDNYHSTGPCKPQFRARVVGPTGSTRAVISTGGVWAYHDHNITIDDN